MSRFLKGRPENLERKRRLRSEMTRSERLLWAKIRARQFQALKFRRQHGIGPYLVDFYCPDKGVVIEIDGDVHAGESQAAKDEQREKYLGSLGLRVIRYMNDDVLNHLEDVLEDLWEKLSSGSTSPSPLPACQSLAGRLTKEGGPKVPLNHPLSLEKTHINIYDPDHLPFAVEEKTPCRPDGSIYDPDHWPQNGSESLHREAWQL